MAQPVVCPNPKCQIRHLPAVPPERRADLALRQLTQEQRRQVAPDDAEVRRRAVVLFSHCTACEPLQAIFGLAELAGALLQQPR